MINRLKQGFRYLFYKFDYNNINEIKTILNEKEIKIFLNMCNYDKLHSFLLYKKIKRSKILGNDINYLKLALLHDCGKENIGLFRRVKNTIIKDKKLDKHMIKAYDKLKEIDIDVAKLCKIHHNKIVNKKMKIFQKFDEE